MASYEILSELCLKQGIKSTINDGIDKFIREDKKTEVRKKINEARNFFKHSKNDADKTIEFNPEVNTFYLWDACRLYKILTSENVSIFGIFITWFSLKHKELMLDENIKNSVNESSINKYINLENKLDFLKIMLPIAENFSDF